jgi:hypothetical protein
MHKIIVPLGDQKLLLAKPSPFQNVVVNLRECRFSTANSESLRSFGYQKRASSVFDFYQGPLFSDGLGFRLFIVLKRPHINC